MVVGVSQLVFAQMERLEEGVVGWRGRGGETQRDESGLGEEGLGSEEGVVVVGEQQGVSGSD